MIPRASDPNWLDARAKQLPRLAYLPFGGGPRLCIGQAFATQESLLILSTIAPRWRLRLIPNETVELEPALTLRPKHGIRMQVVLRDGHAC